MISQSQVTLEDWWHLGVQVFPARELLQHLHGQHKDLPQALLLQWKISRDFINKYNWCRHRKWKGREKNPEWAEAKPGKDACSCRGTPCWDRCCWSYWSWKTQSAEQSGLSRPGFAATDRGVITRFYLQSKNDPFFQSKKANNIVKEFFCLLWSRFCWLRCDYGIKQAIMEDSCQSDKSSRGHEVIWDLICSHLWMWWGS